MTLLVLLQASSSVIFRICGASRGPSASEKLLVIISASLYTVLSVSYVALLVHTVLVA